MVDEYAGKKKVENSEDVSAYDLIMKNRAASGQRPKALSVRFIFSHSGTA